MGNELIDVNGEVVEKIACSANWRANDSTPCALLAQATLDHSHSVLIFCCSKKVCFCMQGVLLSTIVNLLVLLLYIQL